MNVLKDTLDLGFEFYVIDDLRKNGYHMEYFDNLNQALDLFATLDGSDGKMPTLGIQVGNGGLDIIHCLNGENVLIRDYEKGRVLSNDINSLSNEIKEIAQFLIENGVVKYEYDHSIGVLSGKARVIVPVSEQEHENSYIADKILKARDGLGWTAIDSCFVDGHGWVGAMELYSNAEKYSTNGVLKVKQLNVCYVREKNLVGIDGRMDISPQDFAKMVDKINKPYNISVYDGHDYNHQFKNVKNFTVASFDTLPEAVKAWYDINDRTEFTPGVMEKGTGSCVFNGCGENFEEISYEEAAELYGFDKIDNVDKLIAKAVETSEKSFGNVKEIGNIDIEKE